MNPIVWTDKGGCGTCAHCGMDMDMEPYCVETSILAERTKITKRNYPYGLDITPAWKICKGKQWETRKTNKE